MCLTEAKSSNSEPDYETVNPFFITGVSQMWETEVIMEVSYILQKHVSVTQIQEVRSIAQNFQQSHVLLTV